MKKPLLMVAAAVLCAACGPVEVPVADGTYATEVVDMRADGKSRRDLMTAPDTHALKALTLTVDRGAKTVTIASKESGDSVTRGFSAKDVADWPTSCDGILRDDAQEVLALDGPVEIGPLALKAPVVIARCPKSASVFLHEDPKAASCDQVGEGLCLELKK